MELKYPHLFAPITLGSVTFRNRIFASPTSCAQANPPAYLTPDCIAFYALRAKGGAAAVTTGDAIVHSPTGLMHPHKLRLDDPCVIPSLSNLARTIRQYGAVPSIEFSHGGKYANLPNLVSKTTRTGLPPYGPDHEFTPEGAEILEMPEEIILEIVEAYGAAARLARMCGFRMITVHGGHGWLLHQFMSPATNHRKDRYGGSFENRMRFPLMALDSIRKAVGPSFPIEFRMSGAEFTPEGYGIETGIQIAQAVQDKVQLIHVSAGVHDDPDTCVITHPSMFLERGCNVWLAGEIKKHVHTPVATVGALSDPAQMEEIIASGQADIVEMSRSLMADPFLPRKALHGQEEDITKCIRCFLCLNQTATSRNTRCTVNPVIGRETEFLAGKQPAAPKRVLVVGGGPAGMQAALTAAQRGHAVTLCEASSRLGGMLNCEEHVPFKRDLYHLALQLARQVEEAGVQVLLNTPVTRQWAEDFAPDAMICAVGASHIVPPIPGIDGPNVRFLPVLKEANPGFGHKVVILGGGLVGCETAVHLCQQGHQVTVVERADTFAKDATIWHKQALCIQFRKGVDMRLNTAAVGVTPEGVEVKNPDGSREVIPADTVFCAVGLRPNGAIRDELRYAAPIYYSVGDCEQPAQVFDAVCGGYYAALEL